jgi:hypothetical protein
VTYVCVETSASFLSRVGEDEEGVVEAGEDDIEGFAESRSRLASPPWRWS